MTNKFVKDQAEPEANIKEFDAIFNVEITTNQVNWSTCEEMDINNLGVKTQLVAWVGFLVGTISLGVFAIRNLI